MSIHIAGALATVLAVVVIVWSLRTRRASEEATQRTRECRETAAAAGFAFKDEAPELATTGLARVPRFAGCRDDIRASVHFANVFGRRVPGGGAGYVVDYYGGKQAAATGELLFHGTWALFRLPSLDLPVFSLTPTPTLRRSMPTSLGSSFHDHFAVWGERVDGVWVNREAVESLLQTLQEGLVDRLGRGERWRIEGAGMWLALTLAPSGTVDLRGPLPAGRLPAFFDDAWTMAEYMRRKANT